VVAPLDLHGKRFGRWDVLDRATNSKCGQTRWNCVCQCGKRAAIATASLTRGTSTQCHTCANLRVWKNRKTARTPSERIAKWERRKEVQRLRWRRYRMYKNARAELLLAGTPYEQACDLARERVRAAIAFEGDEPEMLKSRKRYAAPPRADLFDISGRTFGSWTVISKGASTTRSAQWVVRCVCGTERVTDSYSLRSGRTTQCVKCQAAQHRARNEMRRQTRLPEAAE
jgi:hypothetical protein